MTALAVRLATSASAAGAVLLSNASPKMSRHSAMLVSLSCSLSAAFAFAA
jgi:hypothetical protein